MKEFGQTYDKVIILYNFLKCETSDGEVFFHYSNLSCNLWYNEEKGGGEDVSLF